MKKVLFILFVFVLIGYFPIIVAAQSNDSIEEFSTISKEPSTKELLTISKEPSTDGWISIQGESITILCSPDADIRKLEARLRERDVPVNQEYRTLLSNRSLSMKDRLKARIEIILLRVKDILGMDPTDLHVRIKIFKTRKEMNAAYALMFNEKVFRYRNLKSFYVHHFKSIYTNEQDILDSVMAHELGHAVIDHYFSVPPPSRMAELMAIYVDAQLDQV